MKVTLRDRCRAVIAITGKTILTTPKAFIDDVVRQDRLYRKKRHAAYMRRWRARRKNL